MKKYISIDIGGTAIKYGIVTENANILRRSEVPTEAQRGGPAILDKTIQIVREAVQQEGVSGVCISTAGMVDPEKGEIIYSAPLIPNYTGTRFKETIENLFDLPCEVENDVNCAGLAEYISGAAQGSKIMVMLTIGTGIGGCCVMNGEVFHGFGNSACEVGYMHMRGSDFQTLGAASILTKNVAAAKNESEDIWNGRRIFEAAKQGDACCRKAIDDMIDVLGEGIANICYVLAPDTFVLGGGIMAQQEYLRDRLNTAVRKYLIGSIASRLTLTFAEHENSAGMLGAFYHFKNRTASL